MKTIMRRVRALALAPALLAGAGCSQLGGLSDVLGGVLSPTGGASEVYGEVRGIDTQRQYIQIQTQNGQVGNVYFDNRTRVVYQNQEYPVTALERGDEIGLRVQQDQSGNAYTDYIQVTRSVQDRGGGLGSGGVYDNGGAGDYRTATVQGTVQWVDVNQGRFAVRTNNQTVTVQMPYSPSYSADQRFRRLRQGESVRARVRVDNNNNAVTLDEFF